MGFAKKITFESGTIGIWELNESSDQLQKSFHFSAIEKSEFQKLKIEKRKKEYLAIRLLIEKLTGVKIEVIYSPSGKPKLKNHRYNISISHSSELVAIILAEKKAGIDTENIFRNTVKIAPRFLSVAEQNTISKSRNRDLKRILYWSAKEAIYKCSVKQEIQFNRQILIHPFEVKNTGQFSASLESNEKSTLFKLHYFFFGNNVVVYCVEE